MLSFIKTHNATQQKNEQTAVQSTASSDKERQRQALLKQVQQDGGIQIIEQE